ncbi:MAG: glutamate--tRNA ligase, partial [Acidobacteriota bacterium]|nr:glutamate--tRNA ligase [Acidobacteriota bacterium]
VERRAGVALRFRVPDDGATVVDDVIRGAITFPHDAYEDFIVVKGNGVVLYPLANAVDDRSMGITHVIRGEDLLPTTPKQVMMWHALNECAGVTPVNLPRYAHLPLLVNESRKKLSKRKDPVSVEQYRNDGYLPEAIVSYLALLGWSPRGDEEIVSRATLIEQFRLEDVSDSPAFFDLKKMAHVNGEFIRGLSPEEFLAACAPWVSPWASDWAPDDRVPPWSEADFDEALWEDVAPLVQTRVATLGEVPGLVAFFFAEPELDSAAVATVLENDPLGKVMLASAIERFGEIDWTADTLHAATAELGEALGWKLRQAQAPIRLAVTGSLVGPPLFESLELLGRELVTARLSAALAAP